MDGLKRKCSGMYRKRKWTENPLMTDEVRHSKNFKYRIAPRADMGIEEDSQEDIEALGIPFNETVGDESRNTPKLSEETDKLPPSDATHFERCPECSTESTHLLVNILGRGIHQKWESSELFSILKENSVLEQKRRQEEVKRREDDLNEKTP